MGDEPKSMKPLQDEQAIFDEALTRSSGEARSEYLATVCGGDVALRRRIEALLRAKERLGNFLEGMPTGLEGAGAAWLDAPPGDRVGDYMGRYKLLEVIGEGGCGVVHMAEQEEPVRRRVAIKVIKAGMDTRSVIARFEAERQALALMDHSNIARVYDAGTTAGGRPYFVMELVRGVRITEYCDEARLSTGERLQLFIKVCEAVQHSHQKGIIHRDIKPSNVLVTMCDGVAVPKVIDFGIAKATGFKLTEKTLFTQFHSFMGTPAYTSPEQAGMSSADVDTRSDIYSLGVLLYELLTGHTPFDSGELLSGGLDRMRVVIGEQEPLRPSTRLSRLGEALVTEVSQKRQTALPELAGALRGDLDWIVMKCLEKDRARRYASAGSLAADVQRHLDSEPVRARPASNAYRFQKWVRRNTILFAAGATIAVTVVSALGISLMQYAEKSRAYSKVVAAELEQSRLLKDANTEREKAVKEAVRSQELARFLQDMLHGVGPGVAQGRDTVLLREILNKTGDRIAADLAGQPELQGDLYSTLGQTYSELTQFREAEEMYGKAVEKYRKALTPPHPKLALALGMWAVAQVTLGNTTGARPNADASLEMARALRDPRLLVTALRHKGRSMDPDQDVPEAAPYLREALEIQKILGDNPSATGDILRQLGGCLAWGATLPEAERCVREALAIHREHLPTNSLALAQDLFNLAQILDQQRRFAEAAASVREALLIVRPQVASSHLTMTSYIGLLSHILIEQEKWDEAEELLVREVSLAPDNASYRNLIGNLLARRGRWSQAAEELKREAALTKEPTYVPLFPVIALLMSGQTNECMELWKASFARHAATREPVVADKLAKLGLMLPLGREGWEQAGQLAHFASSFHEPDWLVPWVAMGRALADLRRGFAQSSIEWAAKCISHAQTAAPCKAGAHFIQALSFLRLNRQSDARTAFLAGTREIASRSTNGDGNYWGLWPDWAIAELLRREAAPILAPQDGVSSQERP